MKKSENLILTFIIMSLSLVGTLTVSAQEMVVPDGYELADSLVYRHVSGVASSGMPLRALTRLPFFSSISSRRSSESF